MMEEENLLPSVVEYKEKDVIEYRRPAVYLKAEYWSELFRLAKVITNEKKPNLSETITRILEWFVEEGKIKEFLRYWLKKQEEKVLGREKK